MVARKTIRNRPRVVDFMFEIPEGLEDVAYDDEFNDADDEDLNEDGDDEDEGDEDPTKKKRRRRRRKKRGKKGGKKKRKRKKRDKKDKKDKDKEDNTDFPRHLRVVKQVIRTKKDGSQVVDLTVDVDKIKGADKYEFRITKKDTGQTTVVNG